MNTEPMQDFRALPAVDQLLNDPAVATLVARHGAITVRNAVRTLQTGIRQAGEVPAWALSAEGYVPNIERSLRGQHYTPVFNLTGTVIHTNLGRALLSAQLWHELEPIVTRPTNLEYDLKRGKRGDRDLIVEEKLKALTGCEAATVVNNNAAALLLVLNTFALGKKVPVSRGELIEIGGSFRLPELMTRSGCELLEVGTTNRTHEKDFAAVLDDAAMLLKVHPSNYHVSGFTKEVEAKALAQLAHQAGIPSCVDLGSGSLVDLAKWGLPNEPTPRSVLEQGVDLVTFSGDKLLGGVQAGLIVGKKALLDQIKANPLKRALRADKITLASLELLLRCYEDPEHLQEQVPLLRTLTLDLDTLERRAEQLASAIPAPFVCKVTASSGQIGSGALPDKTIASVAVTLVHPELSAEQILKRLRDLPVPVIGRIADDKVWLDLRGAEPLDELLDLLSANL